MILGDDEFEKEPRSQSCAPIQAPGRLEESGTEQRGGEGM